MRYYFLYLFCFVFIPYTLLSQEILSDDLKAFYGIDPNSSERSFYVGGKKLSIVETTTEDYLNAMKLECRNSNPLYLSNLSESECFDSFQNFPRMVGCLSPIIKSNDNNFIAFFELSPDPDKEFWFSQEERQIRKELFIDPFKDINTYSYTGTIRVGVAMSLNKDIRDISIDEIEKHVEYKSPDYAKKVFNANKVINYPISLHGEYFQEKYNHCNVLIVYKENAGYFSLYCFYNDKGYKEKKKYSKALDKMLKFKK